jgi:hypothetical protein
LPFWSAAADDVVSGVVLLVLKTTCFIFQRRSRFHLLDQMAHQDIKILEIYPIFDENPFYP